MTKNAISFVTVTLGTRLSKPHNIPVFAFLMVLAISLAGNLVLGVKLRQSYRNSHVVGISRGLSRESGLVATVWTASKGH